MEDLGSLDLKMKHTGAQRPTTRAHHCDRQRSPLSKEGDPHSPVWCSALHSLARPSWTTCCFYKAAHVPPPPLYLCMFFFLRLSGELIFKLQSPTQMSLPLCTSLSSSRHPRFSSKVKQDGPVFLWHSVRSSVTAPVPPHYSFIFPQLSPPPGQGQPCSFIGWHSAWHTDTVP